MEMKKPMTKAIVKTVTAQVDARSVGRSGLAAASIGAMAQTAWAHVFKTDVQMNERIRGFDRPARRAPQAPIPGPVYDKIVNRGQPGAPAEYPTLSKPYPWVAAERKTVELCPPIVGYVGHRPQIRPVFSQSTFMPVVNPRAAVVTDPWVTSSGANLTGHRDEVARLAKSRSQGVLDRYETMRTLSASASGGGFWR
jgi:hypothetical protein